LQPQFVPLPGDEIVHVAWPTPNHSLFDAPGKFFARTRANPDYGKPGFTRDCGKRFHRGVDIAPVSVTATGKTTKVVFTDCVTGKDYESEEPTFVPHDEVSCVFEGKIHEVIDDETKSDFGKHVVIEHVWPLSKRMFYTLYGHLSEIFILHPSSLILSAQVIGRMGQTARSADARNWMAVAPHMHFEVWNDKGQPYDPLEFLRRFCS
jgi:murein DD-endopeptidase MepM/ murein hydrolase activator NlpD